MTFEQIINKMQEAREHCVPSYSAIHIWKTNRGIPDKNTLLGEVVYFDYDNNGINLYFEDYE